MIQRLADLMQLPEIAEALQPFGWEELDHWQQGEFHHDVVLRLKSRPPELPGDIVIVSTNCNGGVKEVACFAAVPDRWGLWHWRCPDNPEFSGPAPAILQSVKTPHWFDPCSLLTATMRSELKPDCRVRQRGGGWQSIERAEND